MNGRLVTLASLFLSAQFAIAADPPIAKAVTVPGDFPTVDYGEVKPGATLELTVSSPHGIKWGKADGGYWTGNNAVFKAVAAIPKDAAGEHMGAMEGEYNVPPGGGGSGVANTHWKGSAKEKIMQIKIITIPKNGKILIGGTSDVDCAIFDGSKQAVHWEYADNTVFKPNDTVKAMTSTMTVGKTPTATKDSEKIHVNIVSNSAAKDEKPLNRTAPTHVKVKKNQGTNPQTSTAPAGNSRIAMAINLRIDYDILDQFLEPIAESNLGGREIQRKEIVPLKSGQTGMKFMDEYIAKKTIQATWKKAPSQTETSDLIIFPDVPVGDLVVTDKKSPDFGWFDTAWKGKSILNLKSHVWQLRVNTYNEVSVTDNTFDLVVTDITKDTVTCTATYTIVTL